MGPRRILAALTAAGLALAPASSARADDPLFDLETRRVPGRPVEVFAATWGLDAPEVVVLSVEGWPPDERRWVTVLGARPLGPAPAPPWVVPVGPDVVAVDAAELGRGPGAELALLTAGSLHIARRDGPAEPVALGPTLPLPPRTRQLSRLRMIRDWSGDGRPEALLPALGGLLLLPLGGGTPRTLSLPVRTLYETFEPGEPLHEGYVHAELVWPSLARADDDGDGRPDLFAFGRFDFRVFRAGPDGLPPEPSRSAAFAPFTFEEEHRHEANTLRAFATDVDGDGRAEVVLHRTEGSLMRSHATTQIFANPGDGAVAGTPAATLDARNGFGQVLLRDLDGDGRQELVQTLVPFGVLQLVRVLVRRRVEATLRVYAVDGPGIDDLRETWSAEVGYGLDFDAARVQGLLPTVDGDWNGDGLSDLLRGDDAQTLEIRLGRRGDDGPGFGDDRARQELPLAVERAVVTDLDGDGLDDLILYDPLDREGRVLLATNRGALPGTGPSLRAPEGDVPPADSEPAGDASPPEDGSGPRER